MNASGTTRNTAEEPIRIGGAVLGILVFLGGIALLVFVFTTARTLFGEAPPPPPVTPLPAAGAAASADAPSAIPALGQTLMDFAKRVLLLLLMCIAGSVIASRGIELFFKACAAAPPRPSSPSGTSGGPTAASAPAATPISSTP